jgi:peptide/nickel transport system substrate-binding protein
MRSSTRVVSVRVVSVVAVAAMAVGLAACGGSPGSSGSSGASGASGSSSGSAPAAASTSRGQVLTIGDTISIGSFDPARANAGTDPSFLDPIFAPLFRVEPDGSIGGVLATSWRYTDSSNKVFQLTLRSGVDFSNGQPVTAAAVVASIKHYESGADGQQWLAGCGNVVAVSASVVQITCAQPNPDITIALSDGSTGGDVVAPASLANPSTLATDPIGAGEYTLDLAATITGSSYVYVANPKYFDQSAIHWDRIVVKVYTNSDTALAALRSGQLQYLGLDDPVAMQAAAGEGLKLQTVPGVFEGVGLWDRSTAGSNPLGNLKVRQALEYAVDRQAIVKALYGQYGSVDEEAAVPSEPTAYDPAVNGYYPYDPAKAKQLLAQAGYPNGFTINFEDQFLDSTLAQAVVGYWNKIGVKAVITQDATIPAWIANMTSRKFAASAYGYGGLPMFMEAVNWFLPYANPFNPFASSDPAMTSLLAKASAETGAAQTADFQAVQAEGVEQAWYIGVAVADSAVILGPGITAPTAQGLYFGNELDVAPAAG